MARKHCSESKILLVVVSLCMIPVFQSFQECYTQNEPITTDPTMSLIIKSNMDVCLQYGINFTILSGISTNRNISDVCVTAIEEGDESTGVVSCKSNINGTEDDVQNVIQINGQYAFPVNPPRHSVKFSWWSPDLSSPQPLHVTRVYISAQNHCNVSTEEGREVAIVYKLTMAYSDIAMDADSGHTLHFFQRNAPTCLHVPGVYSYSYNKESYYIAVLRNVTCKMPARCFKVKMTPFGNVPLKTEEVSLYIQESVKLSIDTSQKQEIKCSGDSFKLNCNSTEDFENILWIKDGINVQEDERYIITSERGFTTLAIAHLTLTDQGTYQCMVQTNCSDIRSDKYTLNILEMCKPCTCPDKETSILEKEQWNVTEFPYVNYTTAQVNVKNGWTFDGLTAAIMFSVYSVVLVLIIVLCIKKKWIDIRVSKQEQVQNSQETVSLVAYAKRSDDGNAQGDQQADLPNECVTITVSTHGENSSSEIGPVCRT